MEPKTLPEPPGFGELTKSEQIHYLQTLWDRISEPPQSVPVLESHLLLAEERLREHLEDPESAEPAYDVIKRLKKNR